MAFRFNRTNGGLPDARRRMIDETSVFLTWALKTRAEVPRIPRRRVDAGGFDWLRAMPAARERIGYWWDATLDRVDRSMR